MANPLIHALVLIAAIIIPGGLLVYFGWRARRRFKKLAKSQDHVSDVEEALQAFKDMYPPESLRAQNRRNLVRRVRAYRRRKSE